MILLNIYKIDISTFFMLHWKIEDPESLGNFPQVHAALGCRLPHCACWNLSPFASPGNSWLWDSVLCLDSLTMFSAGIHDFASVKCHKQPEDGTQLSGDQAPPLVPEVRGEFYASPSECFFYASDMIETRLKERNSFAERLEPR